jgi:hypothetical protein
MAHDSIAPPPIRNRTGRMPGFDARERPITGPADKTRIIR